MEAGIGPEDLDLVECQDTEAASELSAYRELGLCKPDDEAAPLRSGDTMLGGRIPVNVSEGLLSKSEPLDASGLGQVHELVTQLRDEAGPRQVPSARNGLAHVMGAGHNDAPTGSDAVGEQQHSLDVNGFNPMNRKADPREVSSLVVYLASDESSFISGTEIVVDRGELAGHGPFVADGKREK